MRQTSLIEANVLVKGLLGGGFENGEASDLEIGGTSSHGPSTEEICCYTPCYDENAVLGGRWEVGGGSEKGPVIADWPLTRDNPRGQVLGNAANRSGWLAGFAVHSEQARGDLLDNQGQILYSTDELPEPRAISYPWLRSSFTP